MVYFLTKKVIDEYVQRNGVASLMSAKIADFSTGGGAFLMTAISYSAKLLIDNNICESLKAAYKVLSSNVYGCDVDCIALEVAKFNIINFINDISLYKVLSQHFVFGNFLIHSNVAISNDVKDELYLSGYVYHKELAIGMNFLKEYDIILGNPPWEKIRFEEKKFFSQFSGKVADINFKFDLKRAIDNSLDSSEELKNYADEYKSNIEWCKNYIKRNPYFKDSNKGELNTSTLFTDSCYKQKSAKGIVGLIVKSSSLMSPVNKNFYKSISNNILAIYDFINKNRYFNIDSRERFSLLILGKPVKSVFTLGMNIVNINDIRSNVVELSSDDLKLLNPETEQLPNFTSSRDLNFVLNIYKRYKTIGELYPRTKYGRLVHFTAHINYLDKKKEECNLPVYEGKFFSSFDGRYAGFNQVAFEDRYKSKASAKLLSQMEKNRGAIPESRFFIKKDKWNELSKKYNSRYMLAWHSLTSATNSRSCVATILPFIPASQSVQFLTVEDNRLLIYLSCIFNSVIFDFLVKNKLTGIDLTQTIIKQIPIPSYEELLDKKGNILKSLFNTCYNFLRDDARMDGLWPNEIMHKVTGQTREELFALLDALVAKCYNINAKELKYIATKYPKLYNQGLVTRLMDYYNSVS